VSLYDLELQENLDRFSEYFSENKISIENINMFQNHVSVVLGKYILGQSIRREFTGGNKSVRRRNQKEGNYEF
jgi:hypothetical protein